LDVAGKKDCFLILATDGVWQYMSNMEVAKIVFEHLEANDVEGAIESVIHEATKRWMTKEGNAVVDDITCLVVFFDEK